MNTVQRTRIAALLALCGAFGASHALAQSEKTETKTEVKEELKGSYDQPLPKKKQRKGEGAASSNKTTMITTEDGQTYSVTIDDGKVSASINGEEVPADRIKKTDEKVTILGKDGQELKSFNLAIGGSWRGAWQGFTPAEKDGLREELAKARAFNWNMNPPAQGDQPKPPPVMVGINMSDPDPSLLEHLGIDVDSAFMIDRVIDGLPADKAGVKARDVVIALDGEKPATQEKFREILRSKKPGDTLELTILRKGKEERAKLALVAYEREKLGMGQLMPRDGTIHVTPRLGEDGQLRLGVEHGGGRWADEAKVAIEKALKELKDNPDLQPDKIKAEAERALQEALAALKESGDVFVRRYNNWRGEDQPDVIFDRRGEAFAVPAPPNADNNPEMARRLERLTDQLDRLNRRLEEMERRLKESSEKR